MLRQPSEISINGTTLQTILDLHDKWTRGETGGQRADLSGTNLSRANLSGTNLSGADFYGADLSWANFSRANLSGADLSWANFSRADLCGAKFHIAGQDVEVRTPQDVTLVRGSQHDGIRVRGLLKIGCQEHTIAHWLQNVEAIARRAEYSDAEVLEYKTIVNFCAAQYANFP